MSSAVNQTTINEFQHLMNNLVPGVDVSVMVYGYLVGLLDDIVHLQFEVETGSNFQVNLDVHFSRFRFQCKLHNVA